MGENSLYSRKTTTITNIHWPLPGAWVPARPAVHPARSRAVDARSPRRERTGIMLISIINSQNLNFKSTNLGVFSTEQHDLRGVKENWEKKGDFSKNFF